MSWQFVSVLAVPLECPPSHVTVFSCSTRLRFLYIVTPPGYTNAFIVVDANNLPTRECLVGGWPSYILIWCWAYGPPDIPTFWRNHFFTWNTPRHKIYDSGWPLWHGMADKMYLKHEAPSHKMYNSNTPNTLIDNVLVVWYGSTALCCTIRFNIISTRYYALLHLYVLNVPPPNTVCTFSWPFYARFDSFEWLLIIITSSRAKAAVYFHLSYTYHKTFHSLPKRWIAYSLKDPMILNRSFTQESVLKMVLNFLWICKTLSFTEDDVLWLCKTF